MVTMVAKWVPIKFKKSDFWSVAWCVRRTRVAYLVLRDIIRACQMRTQRVEYRVHLLLAVLQNSSGRTAADR